MARKPQGPHQFFFHGVTPAGEQDPPRGRQQDPPREQQEPQHQFHFHGVTPAQPDELDQVAAAEDEGGEVVPFPLPDNVVPFPKPKTR